MINLSGSITKMVRKFVKLLPYFIVSKIVRMMSGDITTFNGRNVHCWRVDKGEFVIYDEENYRILKGKEEKRKKEKLSKKLKKINKQLSKDYNLKKELTEQVINEEEREKEEARERMQNV